MLLQTHIREGKKRKRNHKRGKDHVWGGGCWVWRLELNVLSCQKETNSGRNTKDTCLRQSFSLSLPHADPISCHLPALSLPQFPELLAVPLTWQASSCLNSVFAGSCLESSLSGCACGSPSHSPQGPLSENLSLAIKQPAPMGFLGGSVG